MLIVDTQPVYVLRQCIHTGAPRAGEHDAFTYFIAGNDDELGELVELFQAGKMDERIVEQLPPNDVFEGDFSIETVSFIAPDGSELEWGG